MTKSKNVSMKDKIEKIKEIYSRAIIDINKIKKERDDKVKDLMQRIDKKNADKILKDIKNLE